MSKLGIQIEIPFDPLNFDIDAFDQFVRSIGVKLIHFKAIRCPIGMVELTSSRAPHGAHAGCSNGFIYKQAGEVTASFMGNSASSTLKDQGSVDGSRVSTTFPRYYDNTEEQIYVQLFDRFYIQDLVVAVPNTQLVEAHATGIDKLTYNPVKVESIIDANGHEYFEGDYIIQDNYIKWVGKRPPFDARINLGTIYSIRYLYTPYFYVDRLVHEVRIAHKKDFMTGERVPDRIPYAAILSREYYQHIDEPSDNLKTNPNREMFKPSDSIFGAR